MMTHAQLATASLDDIVFDGRNKTYGAYELRHIYERHVRRAVIIATALFALLLAFPIIANLMKEPYVYTPPKTDKLKTTVIEVLLDVKPPVTPPPAQPAAAAPVAPATEEPAAKSFNTVRFTTEVNISKDVITEVPEIDELLKANPSTVTVTDSGATGISDSTPKSRPGGSGGSVGIAAAPSGPYISVEQMPELPGGGGAAAIVAAIQRAVNYPPQAVRNGVEGRLVASFVVNEKGDITDIKIVKGLGSGLDEETIRAIKTLPRFTPGRQNGVAVSVAYNIPLTFAIR